MFFLFSVLIKTISVFKHEDIIDYTKLTLDNINDQLLVGARDSLFRLSLDNLSQTQYVNLSPKQGAIDSCNVAYGKVNYEII